MKRLSILPLIFIFVGFWSCQTKNDEVIPPSGASGESEVEVSITSGSATRAYEATPDENAFKDLDILLFNKEGKFVCWRTVYRVNNKLRTTLPIGEGYDAYFLANCRSYITAMLPDTNAINGHVGESTWNDFRLQLIDSDPARLLQDGATLKYLPMWGVLKNQNVKDLVLNYWSTLYLVRSVASVDVYLADGVDNFQLKDITLYFVPDKGFLGTDPGNVTTSNLVKYAFSPAGMKTNTLILESDKYEFDDNNGNITNRRIANKLYLYDNDTPKDKATADKRHTRLVIGGVYSGTKYYYPVDFEDTGTDADSLVCVVRNKKYVFNINSVSGPGYTDKETAAEQPSVHLNVTIVPWDQGSGQMGASGNYWLWVAKKEIFIYRGVKSLVAAVNGNVKSNVVTFAFESNKNGTATSIANGIKNDRFQVELVSGADGYPTGLKVTPIGVYSTTDAGKNTDIVVLQYGRIELKVKLQMLERGANDWELDDDLSVELGE